MRKGGSGARKEREVVAERLRYGGSRRKKWLGWREREEEEEDKDAQMERKEQKKGTRRSRRGKEMEYLKTHFPFSPQVNINEPLSFLQRMVEDLIYANTLSNAVASDSTLEEMANVAAFACSVYAQTASIVRMTKPFNPMLGETYECDRRAEHGWRCLMEQVLLCLFTRLFSTFVYFFVHLFVSMCNSDVLAIVLWLCNPVLRSLLFGCIVLGLYYVHVVCVAPIQSYMSPFCMWSLSVCLWIISV